MENYFFEAFEGLDRLAPGSQASTLKAISMYEGPREALSILDIGCGNGIHTMLLAREFPKAKIIAIDNHQKFIENLNKAMTSHGLSERVTGRCISMFDMDFDEKSFDLIWSEGAIYIAGFERGLNEWKKLLKDDGYLICSEVSWLVNSPSEEISAFWGEEYPQIDTIENKIKQIEAAGYNYEGHFITPRSDWTDNYYNPLQDNLDKMIEKYSDNDMAKQVIAMLQREIDLYHKYGNEYSYVFYVMTN
ncbi:MAG: class I SAM-dependent methyltransferase [Gudongella sp.]|nr:class I SAM-dependent methyltransferase [Gudongella sp.]